MSSEDTVVKFPKPIISVMNTEVTLVQQLREAGYNADAGTFGRPYRIKDADKSIVDLRLNMSIPSRFAESEIVVIDLSTSEVLDSPPPEIARVANGNKLRINAVAGIVDPRPYVMASLETAVSRILNHGGLLIVFAAPKLEAEVSFQDDRSHVQEISLNNWSFLGHLESDFRTNPDQGIEVQVAVSGNSWARVLGKHFANARFTTTVDHLYHKNWVPLAANKYGETVAGVYVSTDDQSGAVYVFPHVADKASFVLDLLENVLPEFHPALFPDAETTHWIEKDEYQSLRVRKLRNDIHAIQEEAKLKVEQLRQDIKKEQEAQSYLTDLITATDKPLVAAVKVALEKLGFTDVVNYDDVLAKRGSADLREDLHIRDRSPLVLVEVKGIRGTSTEADALQVTRYLVPRMKELNRTDLRGLSIFNHERHLPPPDRRQQPFRPDAIVNAETYYTGLMTTWSLYKLLRSFEKNGWTHQQVADLFYQDGVIDPIPSHYEHIGTVERYIEKIHVVGIRLASPLSRGARIAFELDLEFEEQVAESIQLDNAAVESAENGALVGVATQLSKQQLREGVRVFRVKPD